MVDLLEDPMTRVTPVAATTAALDAMAGGRP
jgi:hypothetical protein